jgi:hypothetical protein
VGEGEGPGEEGNWVGQRGLRFGVQSNSLSNSLGLGSGFGSYSASLTSQPFSQVALRV